MRRVSILCTLTLLLCPSTGRAQSEPWQTAPRTTAGWVFTPGASLGAAWDTGINTGSNPVVEALFQKWIGMVNPYGTITFNGRRSHLNAGYSGSFEKYVGSTTGYEQHANLYASQTLSPRVTINANGMYAAAPTTDRLIVLGAPTNLPFIQVDTAWIDVGAGLQWQAAQHTSVTGTFHFTAANIDESEVFSPLQFLRDGHSYAPSLQVLQTVTSRVSLGGAAEYRREFLDLQGTFDIRTATGEFSYRLSAATLISGGGGVSQLQLRDTGAQTTSPTFHGAFSHRAGRMDVGASYDRSFRPLYGFGRLTKNQTFEGHLTTPLLDRLYYLRAVGGYSLSDPVVEFGIGTDIGSFYSSVTVGRRLLPWLSAEGYVSVTHQDSVGLESANRTRVGVQVVTARPMRIQ